VGEAESRAPGDAVLGGKSLARMSALSVAEPIGGGGGGGGQNNGSFAPAPATAAQQQVTLQG
jgi:hypothetical protein